MVLGDRISRFKYRIQSRTPDFLSIGRDLYSLLIRPAKAILKGKKSVCIIPDGPLWELPFQALVSDVNRYLIEDHAVFYVPSLAVLKEISRKRVESLGVGTEQRSRGSSGGRPWLLAMGNPIVAETTRANESLEDKAFEPLPDAEAEVKTIARIHGIAKSRVYVGSLASESMFKRDAPDSRIIHLASHGVLDNNDPLYSYVLLATANASEEDGLLEARELMEMHLGGTELAVLSACETAGGRARAGEGLVGMTWALLVSGVPTTVASQWKVPSKETATLMVSFHRMMNAGVSKAEAWRRAVLAMIREPRYRRRPVSWAGFIVVGDGNRN